MTDETPGAENDARREPVTIFSEGSFVRGTLTWGWQCFACRDEETGFGSATRAGEGRDAHETTCPVLTSPFLPHKGDQ